MNIPQLLEGLLKGEPRSLSRAVSLVESQHPLDRPLVVELLQKLPAPPNPSLRLGISGAPGVGKSTLIEAVGPQLINRGHKLAVLTVDPSSTQGRGSLLGDRTRMATLSAHPQAFIRTTASSGYLGGLAPHSAETILLCEAAGFDRVLVESVGVGQSETDLASLVDLFVVLINPGAGDHLQGLKKGILEWADLLVVTKDDGELKSLAAQSQWEYRQALGLSTGAGQSQVLKLSAQTQSGVEQFIEVVEQLFGQAKSEGLLKRKRSQQTLSQVEQHLRHMIWQEVHNHPLLQQQKQRSGAEDGEQTQTSAFLLAEKIFSKYKSSNTLS